MASDALANAWQQVLSKADATSRAWLKSSQPMTVHESIVLIAVPSDYARSRIEAHQRSEIEDALSDAFNRSMQLVITVQPDLELDLGVPDPAVVEELEPNELVRRSDAPVVIPVPTGCGCIRSTPSTISSSAVRIASRTPQRPPSPRTPARLTTP